MATNLTRINNNQITDASGANTQLGINANTKVQNYSITAQKIANNLTYGSDLTIAGNLAVQGNTTTIDSTTVSVEDPLILLASGQTGSPTVDIGFIGQRGTANNIASVWDEALDAFVTVYTDSTAAATTVNILSYADFITGNANITGNLIVSNVSLTGNIIGNLNVSGNIAGGNLLTTGLISVTGSATAGNLLTAGNVSATANVIGGNILTSGLISATSNITGGNILFGAGQVSGTGNIFSTDVNASGNVNLTAGGYVSTSGNVLAGYASITGNVEGGNLLTVGLASVQGNITGGNIDTAGNISATGNISTAANVLVDGYANVTGIISSVGNIVTAANISATGNITTNTNLFVDGYANVTGIISATGAIVTANIISATGNISTAANVLVDGYANVTGVLSVTGNINTAANISATGNITANTNLFVDGYANVTSNVQGGNIHTVGLISATGNITGGNLIILGAETVTGNVTAGNIYTDGTANVNVLIVTGSQSLTGNLQAGNLLTTGIVSATANITGGNIITGGQVVANSSGIFNNGTDGQVNINGSSIELGASGRANAAPAFIDFHSGNAGASDFDVRFRVDGGTGTDGEGNLIVYASNTLFQASNVSIQGTVSASGNINTSSNVNVTGNILASGYTSTTGNVTGGNLITTSLANIGSLITATTANIGTTLTATGNISTAANVNVANNIVVTSGDVILNAGNISVGGNVSAGPTGNVNGANVNTPNVLSATTLTLFGNTGIQFSTTGNINAGNVNIINVADPVNNQDAATKVYVDSIAQGLDIKASVVYATANTLTNLNGAYTYDNGVDGVGATITFSGTNAFTPDGTAVNAGERILVKNETGAYVDDTTPSAAFNGIYVVTVAGGAVSAVLTRSPDMDNGAPSSEFPGAFTFVEYGSTLADTGWVCTTNNPVTVGTTQINWSQFSGAGTYSAGAGLSLTGTVFSAETDGNTTYVDVNNKIAVYGNMTFTTPNLANATFSSLSATGATGNIFANNISISGSVNTVDEFASGNVSAVGYVSAANVYVTTLGNTAVPFANVDGALVSNAALTFAGGTLNSGNVSVTGSVVGTTLHSANTIVTTLSNTQVVFADAAGTLIGNNNLTTNGTNLSVGGNLSVTGNVTVTGNTSANIATVTNLYASTFYSNAVTYANSTGFLINTNQFTYNDTTDTLSLGNVSTSGNVTAANFKTSGSQGNITGANIISAVTVTASGNIDATNGNIVTDLTVGGNIYGNVIGNISATTISVTGNVTGGNFLTSGLISAQSTITSADTITGGNLIFGSGVVSGTGNITGGNILFGSGQVSGTGNIYADTIFANISGNIDAAGSNTWVQFADTGDILGASAAFTFDKVANLLTITGNTQTGNLLTGGLVSATGNAIAGNILTAGLVSATGNTTAGNLLTGGFVTATGNIATAGNILTDGYISATGNISTAGNILTDGYISATGDISTAGNIISIGNTTAGNLLTGGVVSATANVIGNNIIAITSVVSPTVQTNALTTTNSVLTIGNVANSAVAIDGFTANLVFVSSTTNTVAIGSNVLTDGATLAINAVDSILLPTGNTLQRPATPATGMIRWNTTESSLEAWSGIEWQQIGTPDFTVITNEQFDGDGTTTTFNLVGNALTTNSCIVTINGVVQIPTTAYAVTGTPTAGSTLEFSEAPAVGDVIDVREITSTKSINSLSAGNASFTLSDTTGATMAGGNLTVAPGGFLIGDGSQLSNIGGNVSTTHIVNGTSNVYVSTANSNVTFGVNGTSNAMVVGATATTLAGDLLPAGNVTANLGSPTQQWKTLYVSGNTIYIGGVPLAASNNNITFNGNSIVTANPSGTSSTTGNMQVVGNVTGSNFLTGGVVSATGNITGNNLSAGIVTINTELNSPNWFTNYLFIGGPGGTLQQDSAFSANTTSGNLTVYGNIKSVFADLLLQTGNVSAAGNITGSLGTFNGGLNVTGNINATGNINYTNVNDLVVGDPLIYIGANNTSNLVDLGLVASANVSGVYQHTGLVRDHTVNVWKLFGNVAAEPTTVIDWANAVYAPFSAGAITSNAAISAATTISAVGNVYGANVITSGNIATTVSAVGNIGSSTFPFNTVFAQATSAVYADLAEKYVADAEYAPGTVVAFGGEFEVTSSNSVGDRRVAGVVSTNPSYIMNGALEGNNIVTVALTGRVPTSVTGRVQKGDLMVSNGDGSARAESDPKPGSIIGKALADFDGETGVIEVVIGRF